MPLFAKILAFLNVIAAGVFIYIASLDYGIRQQWAYEVFRRELVLDGLPVDEKDSGRRVADPIYPDIAPDALDLFDLAGAGDAVSTQKKEVETLRAKIKADVEKLEGDARRARVKELLLGQTATFDERNAILKAAADKNVATDTLKDQLLAKFDDALADKVGETEQDAVAKRRAIAHLLYNLDAGAEPHHRLMIVIGLKAYAQEANQQAALFRDLIEQTKLMTINDRINFIDDYEAKRDRLVYLAHETQLKEADLKRLKGETTLTKAGIAKNEEAKDALEKAFATAEADTQAALRDQAELERQMFKIHKEVGSLIEGNLKQERELGRLERGSSRGGRP